MPTTQSLTVINGEDKPAPYSTNFPLTKELIIKVPIMGHTMDTEITMAIIKPGIQIMEITDSMVFRMGFLNYTKVK